MMVDIYNQVILELSAHHIKKGDSWKTMDDGLGFMEDEIYKILHRINEDEDNYKHELIDIIGLCVLMYHRKEIDDNNV